MVIEILSALLLIILVLMQKSKSQGMGLAFGGAMGESLFGAQMGNVLTKATVILAVVFLVNTTILAMIGPSEGRQSAAALIPESSAPAQQMPSPPIQSALPVPPMEGVAPVVNEPVPVSAE